LQVPLSEELGGGLRLVKAQGNIASESLEMLQRRGEYEAVPQRKQGSRRKRRVKVVERWS
jgi:hypothetical protein